MSYELDKDTFKNNYIKSQLRDLMLSDQNTDVLEIPQEKMEDFDMEAHKKPPESEDLVTKLLI